ncbi:MAG: Succinate dehydrogenase cytochrome b556 subunit [Alphaproteobacteria bacterium MarineAlpha3_Bin5]|nr:succinate dehydrogenase, cytochrome b556 subunit [Magnetovibrio sp.]PPR77418.1 MAG: Succinate dehydrogenase cytochrome b556 subunit [Alphaproteobacteria bacterium MarineAlpha3_Bin5]
MGSDNGRPISPHLQIYRPQITSILSITHRFTGIILSFGACLLFYWLTAASLGVEAYNTAQSILSSWIGKFVMLGVVFSVWYHLANGIRHLFWDIGVGFELTTLRFSGLIVVISSGLLTFGTYMACYILMGIN